jgi:hypothetical protein
VPQADPSLERVSAVEFGVKAFCEVNLEPAKVRGTRNPDHADPDEDD